MKTRKFYVSVRELCEFLAEWDDENETALAVDVIGEGRDMAITASVSVSIRRALEKYNRKAENDA